MKYIFDFTPLRLPFLRKRSFPIVFPLAPDNPESAIRP